MASSHAVARNALNKKLGKLWAFLRMHLSEEIYRKTLDPNEVTFGDHVSVTLSRFFDTYAKTGTTTAYMIVLASEKPSKRYRSRHAKTWAISSCSSKHKKP